MNKKQPKAVSDYYSKLGKASAAKRRKKILDKAKAARPPSENKIKGNK